MTGWDQGLLGAAVGELVLGKKVGKKAPLWGAAAGTSAAGIIAAGFAHGADAVYAQLRVGR